ncbi:MAG: bifunctional [glutamate--ammonia ligase]-adenylyl-L-tyrosine phosphorylase/[glutamate--ammonia-ligase] adenylyltransferase, partial [Spongiibacteraceae bacterium]|nr:bifunctional [glutamate--ammonia ligase]-adenylyl-L-tyrosine phosphorylase/[glutamate--ammonia-ligase] adenylyltransferase [Spongiibacteraceae bacterium]
MDNIPPLLAEDIQKKIQQFNQRNSDYESWFSAQLCEQVFAAQLIRAWSASQYCADLCLRFPAMFQALVEQQDLQREIDQDEFIQRLNNAKLQNLSVDQLNAALRQCRAKEMLRIIWRDVNRLADLQETTRDVSCLADNSIACAVDFHHQQLCKDFGRPMALVEGEYKEQHLVVLGMGKLGAYELNLSSDIDLIFSYPSSGETVGAPQGQKTLDNHQFFTRLGQRVIASLDAMTVDGFVFRVDMRLRPYGESGSLVLSFDAMEEYYQNQGREWERYAMIKARVVCGGEQDARCLINLLRPFTYRRYIDFSVIESLRTMKKMIRQEIKRRGLQNDVKLGAGGIRDIEFIVQSFQLIRGGREEELQQRSVLTILSLLAEKKYLPVLVVEQLLAAYHFLRNTEHGIQAFNDRQTQTLPSDLYARTALAFTMGFTQWDDFVVKLNEHRKNVSEHFQQIIAADEDDKLESVDESWQQLWISKNDRFHCLQSLRLAGHEQAEDVLNRIIQLRDSQTVSRMQMEARERVDLFMPLLLQAVTRAQQPSIALLRILPLVEAVLRRTAYLVLLVENQGALQRLVILCEASPWIATQLARHPVLLDELLDARTLYTVPEKQNLQDELQQQMLRVNWDDLESHMDALRYFKQAHQLRVIAAEVVGYLPVMKVSDYLTVIAEVILDYVLELAWHYLVEKHGRPQSRVGVSCDKGFIIVGYGKLGGIELAHNSDLDLVFIHSGDSGLMTEGERPIDNSVFFARLGQRMIHILSAQTSMGQLYEIDMRLRPSGESGLLVSSLSAFDVYQHNKAWTWEHQALVRARVVAGDSALTQAFERVRAKLLCQKRDKKTLKNDVGDMRRKMRDHLMPIGLETAENPIFHLKHGRGAIVDIEFMV